MRRIITILILIFILIFVGTRVFKKKPVKEVKKTVEMAKKRKAARRAEKKAGGLEKREKKSKEERRKERELKKLEKKRLKEERKRQRELAKLQRQQRKKRSKKKTAGMYILQAIITTDNNYYALIDGKQYKIGDEVGGRRIVKIEADKITLDYFGEITTARVGEPCVPLTTLKTKKQR
uniref:Uncharacterized protein n=1 Tax=candidate division WOR-3 bacterium TaxID=2052148 RepID=A0A7V5XZQ1_UNCW3